MKKDTVENLAIDWHFDVRELSYKKLQILDKYGDKILDIVCDPQLAGRTNKVYLYKIRKSIQVLGRKEFLKVLHKFQLIY